MNTGSWTHRLVVLCANGTSRATRPSMRLYSSALRYRSVLASRLFASVVAVGAALSLGAHCGCPDQALLPASYDVETGQFTVDDMEQLSFDDCKIEPGDYLLFGTDEVPTYLEIECGVPVLEPIQGQPLFRLTVPLGDLRDGADQDIDLSTLNFIAEWSSNGVPVGPSRVPEGGTAIVRTTQQLGSRAPYPLNVTDDFVLEFTIEITIPAFFGRGGSLFPGGSMQVTIAQDATDYRRDPGPDPDCM